MRFNKVILGAALTWAGLFGCGGDELGVTLRDPPMRNIDDPKGGEGGGEGGREPGASEPPLVSSPPPVDAPPPPLVKTPPAFPPPLATDCCAAREDPGCDEASIANCVCDRDPYCCAVSWDQACVDEAASGCALMCATGPEPQHPGASPPPVPPPPGSLGSCCHDNPGRGCEAPATSRCVCDIDPFCCEVRWDQACVEVAVRACGACEMDAVPPARPSPMPEPDPDPEPSPTAGACCEASDAPGCEGAMIEACVCAFDAFCCEVAWDAQCVAEVDRRACGTCEAPAPPPVDPPEPALPPCCGSRRAPGCGVDVVEACVCGADPYCCEVAWDDQCVRGAIDGGCTMCPP